MKPTSVAFNGSSELAELAPQSVPSVPGVGGFTALVHEQLLRNESCAQRGVRIHRE